MFYVCYIFWYQCMLSLHICCFVSYCITTYILSIIVDVVILWSYNHNIRPWSIYYKFLYNIQQFWDCVLFCIISNTVHSKVIIYYSLSNNLLSIWLTITLSLICNTSPKLSAWNNCLMSFRLFQKKYIYHENQKFRIILKYY